MALEGYHLSPLLPSSIDAAYALETESFPADEAATLESITHRQKSAGQFFLGLYTENELVGFVNGTLTAAQELHHDTMTKYVVWLQKRKYLRMVSQFPPGLAGMIPAAGRCASTVW
jgi:hypothetical protein